MLVLGGCASVYRVSPVIAPEQVQVVAPQGESVRSAKKHVVELSPVRYDMRQFDSPRFYLRFVNQGKEPLEFSSENVSAVFNGRQVRVLSYEDQIQEVQNRLSFYGFRAPVFYGPFRSPYYKGGAFYHGPGGFRGGFVAFEDFTDHVDIQNALADLDYIQKHSLKPKVIRPGQEIGGEVVVAAKLSADRSQDMVVTIQVDGEQHVFKYGYDQIK